ncbi:hypothetical protein ACFUCH_35465 [Streptomyces olivaceus]|uniref:hypothetical protein n=1 Tax=Streptomyces olivaceus TaxID=47716 RepID=UPI00362C16E7
MNQQQRYVIGKRDERGYYSVAVDGAPAGTVHRRHGSWYAVIPGHPMQRCADRDQAAAHLVALVDQGARPTVPAPAPAHSPAARMRAIVGMRATRTYAYLLPDLRPTLPNFVRAVEAMARLAQLGWVPLEGYPGADQPWLMECRLCGWKGRRFWSHLRGRNGNGVPRPITRHPGCIPVKEHHLALINLSAERQYECRCEFTHPTSVEQAQAVLGVIEDALNAGAAMGAAIHTRGILEPCPASSRRALVLRDALNRRINRRKNS